MPESNPKPLSKPRAQRIRSAYARRNRRLAKLPKKPEGFFRQLKFWFENASVEQRVIFGIYVTMFALVLYALHCLIVYDGYLPENDPTRAPFVIEAPEELVVPTPPDALEEEAAPEAEDVPGGTPQSTEEDQLETPADQATDETAVDNLDSNQEVAPTPDSNPPVELAFAIVLSLFGLLIVIWVAVLILEKVTDKTVQISQNVKSTLSVLTLFTGGSLGSLSIVEKVWNVEKFYLNIEWNESTEFIEWRQNIARFVHLDGLPTTINDNTESIKKLETAVKNLESSLGDNQQKLVNAVNEALDSALVPDESLNKTIAASVVNLLRDELPAHAEIPPTLSITITPPAQLDAPPGQVTPLPGSVIVETKDVPQIYEECTQDTAYRLGPFPTGESKTEGSPYRERFDKLIDDLMDLENIAALIFIGSTDIDAYKDVKDPERDVNGYLAQQRAASIESEILAALKEKGIKGPGIILRAIAGPENDKKDENDRVVLVCALEGVGIPNATPEDD